MFPIIFGGINRREPWNPGDIPGTPREWLAGPDWCFTDTAGTIPAGDTDAVAAWRDRFQSTLVTQTDPLRRPTLRLVSGKWVVRFDGVNDFLEGSLSSADVAHSVWAAYTLSADGSFPMLVVTRSSVREMRHLVATRRPQIIADTGAATATDATAVALNTPTRLIGTYGATGGATTLYRAGVSVATDAADSTTAAPNTICIGARPGPSLFLPGDIASAGVAVGQTLSVGNVALLDTYLAGVL